VDIAGITVHPDERWMQQMARNVTMDGCGALRDCHYLLHDRDTKYTISFRAIIESGGVKPLALPARSPNLNAYAERWVRSVKDECLSKIILFGERSLRRALSGYVAHYHAERNHQGKSNVLLFRRVMETRRDEPVQCRGACGVICSGTEMADPTIPRISYGSLIGPALAMSLKMTSGGVTKEFFLWDLIRGGAVFCDESYKKISVKREAKSIEIDFGNERIIRNRLT
jgi:hypothetical protein